MSSMSAMSPLVALVLMLWLASGMLAVSCRLLGLLGLSRRWLELWVTVDLTSSLPVLCWVRLRPLDVGVRSPRWSLDALLGVRWLEPGWDPAWDDLALGVPVLPAPVRSMMMDLLVAGVVAILFHASMVELILGSMRP